MDFHSFDFRLFSRYRPMASPEMTEGGMMDLVGKTKRLYCHYKEDGLTAAIRLVNNRTVRAMAMLNLRKYPFKYRYPLGITLFGIMDVCNLKFHANGQIQ